MTSYTKAEQTSHNKKPNKKRVSITELNERVAFLINKEICQVCEESYDLDYPHHAEFGGYKKDDRSMINICIDCHRTIHTKGFDTLNKTRKETALIGKRNNEEFLNEYN